MLVAARVTHQPQACCQIFDLLVDEAAELELAFLAFDWLLILRLCALHTDRRVKRNRAQNSHKHLLVMKAFRIYHAAQTSKQIKLTGSGYVVSNSTPKYWSIKFFFVQAEAALLSVFVCRLKDHISA